MKGIAFAVAGSAASLAAVLAGAPGVAAGDSFVGGLHTVSTVGSTVPANGDVNPYGIAVVRSSDGRLVDGDVLVSNFNNRANLQGTGTTIVQLDPASGARRVFARIDREDVPGCPGGVGLTTALAILQDRWVVVGSLPTRNGMANTAKAGCLIVLNQWGDVVETLSGHGINGPWDLTAVDRGDDSDVFVSTVLNGTVAAGGAVVNRGAVERIVLDTAEANAPVLDSVTTIGSGFSERTDPNALVIGPTGLALGRDGSTLYVADTLNNRISAIPDALQRSTTAFTGADVSSGGAINGPLGLATAPNGDLIEANGGDGNLVELARGGAQFMPVNVEPAGGGSLFGLAVTRAGVFFVDDSDNTLKLLH